MISGRGLALVLARLSALCYERRAIGVDLAELGYALRRRGGLEHNETQAMLVEAKDLSHAAIVFRGTEASRGVLRDIWANVGWPERWAGRGRVHEGYHHAYSMIRDTALEMGETVSRRVPLYATGHSLGGALAGLFAAHWYALDRGYRLAGLVTFGAPKSMDSEAARPIACPASRYVNRYDPAPYWPPSFVLTSPGVEIGLDSGGWPGPVTRHGVGKYVEALAA